MRAPSLELTTTSCNCIQSLDQLRSLSLNHQLIELSLEGNINLVAWAVQAFGFTYATRNCRPSLTTQFRLHVFNLLPKLRLLNGRLTGQRALLATRAEPNSNRPNNASCACAASLARQPTYSRRGCICGLNPRAARPTCDQPANS